MRQMFPRLLDQGSVNPVLNQQILELKQTLLPNISDNWDDLSHEH